MPDRDLDITKFSYKSYRKLKKSLGEFDAVVECNEIAIREFIEKANTEDSEKYIQQLSIKHRIKVDNVDFVKFSSRIRQFYIVSVTQQFEQFLADFRNEWKKYFPDRAWIPRDRDSGETELDNCLKNIQLTKYLVEFGNYINHYDYYRLVRNFTAHTDRDIKAIERSLKKIEMPIDNICRIPNSLENIDFTDFHILTNVVKHIAFVICQRSKPDNDIIAQVLFDISKENKANAYNGLKKLKNDDIRYRKALSSFVVTNFGRISESDLEQITNKLKSLLA
ncbi:hypothetical protein DOJK_00454 [Patescibacteria group bacterium]|nr:hypothetical protein DOJK_00454 [Patescibacteria group bacterium]